MSSCHIFFSATPKRRDSQPGQTPSPTISPLTLIANTTPKSDFHLFPLLRTQQVIHQKQLRQRQRMTMPHLRIGKLTQISQWSRTTLVQVIENAPFERGGSIVGNRAIDLQVLNGTTSFAAQCRTYTARSILGNYLAQI